GCLERYCSATALIRMAREEAERRPDALYLRRAGGNPDDITGRLVIDAAREGDPAAVRVFDEYTESLACAVNTVISFLDPEVIVLGGGISLAGSFLLDAVRGKLPKYLMFKSMPYSRVELAVLGNDAGIIGAAMLGMVMHHPTQALGVKGDSL
ncbi:MAG TPA: ROK family protein, partial [Candidatus Limnocylindria bacterium]|nr:ROK family protein [Candidatus Limnocylindria bacterium]